MFVQGHLFGRLPDDQILENQQFSNQLLLIGFLVLNTFFSVIFALIGFSVLQIVSHIFLSAILVFSYLLYFFFVIGHKAPWYLMFTFLLVSYGFFVLIHSNNFASYVVGSTLLFVFKSVFFGLLGGLSLANSPIGLVGAVDEFINDCTYAIHKRIYGTEPQVY